MSQALDRDEINRLSNRVIGAAIEVHRLMGPGLLESTYEECLVYELEDRGIRAARQVMVPLKYKGRTLSTSYRIDLLVNDSLLIEVKSVEQLAPIHESQVLTYLRLTELPLGLLLNFNCTTLVKGLRRLANGM